MSVHPTPVRSDAEVAERVLARRGLPYDELEQGIMAEVFRQTESDRVWDNKK